MTTNFPDQPLISLIKRAMRGDERHQYTYSQMVAGSPDRAKELAQEAQSQLVAEGEEIVWIPEELS